MQDTEGCRPPEAVLAPRFEGSSNLYPTRSSFSSPGEGLQHVKSMRLKTQLSGEDDADPEDDEEVEIIGGVACFPPSMSTHLNSLIRILLKRMPRGYLTEFMYVSS